MFGYTAYSVNVEYIHRQVIGSQIQFLEQLPIHIYRERESLTDNTRGTAGEKMFSLRENQW